MAKSWGQRWYRWLLGGTARRARGGYRPWVERLEDRTVPSFLAAANFFTGSQPISVAVADVNGDGKPDLLVTNFGSADMSVLLGNGNGSFLPAQNFTTGAGSASVAVADLNDDGLLDLAVANTGSNTVSVLLGQHR